MKFTGFLYFQIRFCRVARGFLWEEFALSLKVKKYGVFQ